ncbi:MAG TPA: hypothetical protein DEH25_02775 [Chloroflexi bacterium]|nr:hypothetical protein [Chloroflexota bacterium]HBY07370.1 hypothetical protein [Chloroflexota bacterium]
MSNLFVFAFETPTGAAEMRDALVGMQKEHIITLEDAAVVVRKPDGKVKVKQAVSLVGAGAWGGAFWGMLIGMLFWAPWLGLAVGAVTGALSGAFSDIGVDDKFIKEVGSTIELGHSALFLLVSDVTADKVLERLEGFSPKIIQTSLSNDDEAKLRAAFGAEEE